MDTLKKEQIAALKEFEKCFSNFINASFDPWEVDKWRDEVWDARKKMGVAFDAVRETFSLTQ